MRKSTPRPLEPLPPEAFPITGPATDIIVFPAGNIGSNDDGISIDWRTYSRNAGAWMLPPEGDLLPWPQHMVLAKPQGGPGALTANQTATLLQLADNSTVNQLTSGSNMSPDSARHYLSSIYSALGVNNACSAVTALILSGIRPPEADPPSRQLEETEVQMFALFSSGYTQSSLAKRFDSSPAGVSRRVAHLCEALGLDGAAYAPAASARLFRLGVFIVGRRQLPITKTPYPFDYTTN